MSFNEILTETLNKDFGELKHNLKEGLWRNLMNKLDYKIVKRLYNDIKGMTKDIYFSDHKFGQKINLDKLDLLTGFEKDQIISYNQMIKRMGIMVK